MMVFLDGGLNATSMSELDRAADRARLRWAIETLRVVGFAVVPIKPTDEMVRLGWEGSNAGEIWERMVKAAPEIT